MKTKEILHDITSNGGFNNWQHIARIDSIIAMFPQAIMVSRSNYRCRIYLKGFRIELEVLENGNYLDEKVIYTGNVGQLYNLLNK